MPPVVPVMPPSPNKPLDLKALNRRASMVGQNMRLSRILDREVLDDAREGTTETGSPPQSRAVSPTQAVLEEKGGGGEVNRRRSEDRESRRSSTRSDRFSELVVTFDYSQLLSRDYCKRHCGNLR